jgi:hypothetical protein
MKISIKAVRIGALAALAAILLWALLSPRPLTSYIYGPHLPSNLECSSDAHIATVRSAVDKCLSAGTKCSIETRAVLQSAIHGMLTKLLVAAGKWEGALPSTEQIFTVAGVSALQNVLATIDRSLGTCCKQAWPSDPH